ncbi:myb-like protein X isoform X2 [Onthophagus taurus]|uniref:myb-like protein X isoform X2 n=1 Tax=Onthophagus taurus TaxID=166361 RepID=UPI0039BDD670
MYTEKRLSLVERKKLQWAREREELAELNAAFSRDSFTARSKNVSNLQSTPVPRRQSLPPLYKSQNSSFTSIEKLAEREMGGETSGYGSDNVNTTPEHYESNNWENSLGYESSSSAREDRAKWGDRGVHVAKYWEPKDNLNKAGTPGWVRRGLEGNTQLEVANSSPAESPEQDYLDRERPCTSSTASQIRCYIRGQNIPVEPVELAERERRRQIALAHQEAIREQLEERDRRKKEERERLRKEEFEEEQRIKREKDIERQRKEREDQLLKEKLEREKKRKEALKEAIEIAEKQAIQEKSKLKLLKQKNMNNINMKENVIEKDSEKSPRKNQNIDKENVLKEENEDNEKIKNNINEKIKIDDTKSNKNNISEKKNFLKNKNEVNIINEEEESDSNNKKLNNDKTPVPPLQLNPQSDALALVLQTPYETLQNMQFAVLMPTNGTTPGQTLPIAVPITVSTDRSNTSRTENRLLTPSQYRNKKLCDSSTQTDLSELTKISNENKYTREKLNSVDGNYESNRSRKERRGNRGENMVEGRPKWGVNRPPTRYLKQSEKDLVYQRRKLRQKQRQEKNYDEKTYDEKTYDEKSSDDSQTNSPRTYRKNYPEKRRGRALWRNNQQLFSQNIRVFQREIIPLESDKDQIYYKDKQCLHCCCRCRETIEKYNDHFKVVDILKIEHNTPGDSNQLLPDNINNNSMDSCSEALSTSLQNDYSLKQDWEN